MTNRRSVKDLCGSVVVVVVVVNDVDTGHGDDRFSNGVSDSVVHCDGGYQTWYGKYSSMGRRGVKKFRTCRPNFRKKTRQFEKK